MKQPRGLILPRTEAMHGVASSVKVTLLSREGLLREDRQNLLLESVDAKYNQPLQTKSLPVTTTMLGMPKKPV